jgi:DNA polymerase elongation subunit (family B)
MSNQYTPSSLHGKVISYNQIKKLPSRNLFLEKEIYAETSENILTGSTLLFMPNGLHEMHLQEKKYEKSQYKIVLFGALIDGRRATVVISGIKPHFEVVIPIQDDDSESSVALDLYKKLKQTKYSTPNRFEILKGKQFKGYQKDRRVFARFYFDKLKTRTEAIKYVRSNGFDTTADDTSCYYRVVCRDHLTTFSSWVNIDNYNIRTYSGIRGSVYEVNISDYKKCDDDITKNPRLAKDNIMSMCWDIETYSPDGQLPRPENPDHKMFMIGITFQWHHGSDQILRVCLVDHPCDSRPNYLTVICGDEKKLIKAFGKLVYKMKPGLNLGFNDSDYDWPWLVKRAKLYPGTLAFLAECFDSTVHWKNYDDESVFSYNFKKEKVKLEADAYADGYTLIFPGYINIDVRTIFRQLYPTAEKSNLNFYLELNKLGGKKDMPYQELFRIYGELDKIVKRRTAINKLVSNLNGLAQMVELIMGYDVDVVYNDLKDKMAEIADYCIIDSQRCHELMKIRSVVMDRREVSNLSYTSVFDSFYRANGMKVRNLVIARGQERGIKFSNITNNEGVEEGKYPGAYVFPPKKGLVISKLTIKERRDHATVMPKYAEWFEVSDEELKEYYEIINKHGACMNDEKIYQLRLSRENSEKQPLRKCFVDFLLEKTGRPITGLDFSSLYPSLIMTYNLSPEYIITNVSEAKKAKSEGHNLYKIKFMFNDRWVRGWSIRHDNKIDSDDPDCKFGVYPMILKELFDTRKNMKKGLHNWESKKEQLETLPREEFIKPEIQNEYETVCFNYNYIDSKQKALKVFMNTFYGESGNKRSPFFVLQLAGAITTAGQENIKMVQKHVEDEGCNVYYGDSVTYDTPLILRDAMTHRVMIKTIDDIADEKDWKSYDQFKPGEPDRIQKQQVECSYQIWTEGDWHYINRVIRHKTNKKMYRVNTHTGCIDVTADHSLMTPDRIKIKPSELDIGTELLHSFPTEFPEILATTNEEYNEYIKSMNHVSKEESYVWGFFMACGSCGDYMYPSGNKESWVINNKNIKYLNQVFGYLSICEQQLKFKLSDTMNSSGMYKLVATGYINHIVEKYRKLFYDKREYKLVPSQILNGSREIRQAFYDGYCAGDGHKQSKQNTTISKFYCKGKITSQCMYYLVKSLGYKYVSIGLRNYNPDIYSIRIRHYQCQKNPIAVKKIVELPAVNQETFVYDIETSKGSFLGGVGAINAKNTDSIYSAMPEKHFNEIDKIYYTGGIEKVDYWSEQVNITFREIAIINKTVNEMLVDDNGTKFLKMAFEESLFPVTFLAKKKYYGIPHISVPNFQPKNLFIRGLEVKKRGVSEFLRKVCMNIMWDSVSQCNLYTLLELVQQKIDYIYKTEWDFTDFIMTDVFKPNKNNIKVHTFVQRMLNRRIKVKPYDRFSYVIIKKNPYTYDERGRKKNLSIGDKMEYADQAREQKMSIDIDYYMKGSINGQLSRLITYAEIFHIEPESASDEDLKIAEDKTYQNSCKYIENYCTKYYTNYVSKGSIYQKIFRIANSVVTNKVKEYCDNATISILNSSYDIENLESWLEKKAEKESMKFNNGYGKTHIMNIVSNMKEDERATKINELQKVYFARKSINISSMREKSFKERQTLLQRQVRDNLSKLVNVLNYHTKMVGSVQDKIKNVLNINNMYNDADSTIPDFDNLPDSNRIDLDILEQTANREITQLINNDDLLESLNKLRYIYINMVSNYSFIQRTRLIIDYLMQCRNKTIGLTQKPKDFKVKKYITNNVDDIILEMRNEI